MKREQKSSRRLYPLAVIAVLFLFPGALALGISVSPDQIERGDQVTITIAGLPDNSTFSLQIEGSFAVSPGGTFSFATEDLVMPFALEEGTLSARLTNTETNILSVRRGDTEVRKVGSSTNGVFSTSDSGSIPAGTYDSVSLSGTAAPDATSIIARMVFEGKKKGPADSQMTFVVEGVTSGLVTVTVRVDGTTALSRTIVVGTSPTATTVPTTSPPGGSGSSSGGGNPVSGSSPVSGTTGSTPVPTPTVTLVTPTRTIREVTAAPTAGPTGVPVEMTKQETEKATPAPTKAQLLPALAGISLALGAIAIARRRR
ncbi:MAG: hypothetical protein NQU46_03995 [Methanolinea sp.]|nr:hypothetical protein [Methanolinea sp.]